MNKTTARQVERGVSGFISRFSVAAGPLNSQRSDHSSVCSLTPHQFIHSLIQQHIQPHTSLLTSAESQEPAG